MLAAMRATAAAAPVQVIQATFSLFAINSTSAEIVPNQTLTPGANVTTFCWSTFAERPSGKRTSQLEFDKFRRPRRDGSVGCRTTIATGPLDAPACNAGRSDD